LYSLVPPNPKKEKNVNVVPIILCAQFFLAEEKIESYKLVSNIGSIIAIIGSLSSAVYHIVRFLA